jgi:[acyl-carrier-protein] S-malonyltransferase
VTVAAWVDGEAVPSAEVEARLVRLRERDLTDALPAPQTREGRQLRRWVTSVAVVERLCAAELASREACGASGRPASPWPAGTPSPSEAAAMGSIVAAAWANEPAVAQAAAAVTQKVRLDGWGEAHAARLASDTDGVPIWSSEQLVTAARLDAFVRWLAAATRNRVRLEPGYEHPGDSTQPDYLHEH